jgi:hypothetical protein
MTGCAKFFIFAIIAAPLAYLGANYLNTGDPLNGIRHWFDQDSTTVEVPHSLEETNGTTRKIETLELELERLKSELENCRDNKSKQN